MEIMRLYIVRLALAGTGMDTRQCKNLGGVVNDVHEIRTYVYRVSLKVPVMSKRP